MHFFSEFVQNKVLMIAISAWFIAQVFKVFLTLLLEKKLDFTLFIGSGGMPSSHSSFSMALTTAVGKLYGWSSPIFAISLSFSLIVMYDAAGVRRAAGEQARILNKMIYDKKITEERLRELIGHTPKQVIAGALLGITIANLFYEIFY